MLLRDFEPFSHTARSIGRGAFLDEWCLQVMRSRIGPMKKGGVHAAPPSALVLNWFRARGETSVAVVEGFNNKAKLTARKAYGFRSYRCVETALYHTLVGYRSRKLPADSAEDQKVLETRFDTPSDHWDSVRIP
jgi:hypothetical protein